MTERMKLTLEKLYETSGHEDWVNMTTAYALQYRGLVVINVMTSRTAGGTFPAHMTKLTDSGISWCQRHMANIRRPGRGDAKS